MINAATTQPTHPSAPNTIDDFLKFKPVEHIPAKTLLYRGGATHFFHVVEGAVRVYREGDRNVGIAMYGAGSWFGEEVVYGMQDRTEAAQALTDCMVMRWTAAEVLRSCESPSGYRAFAAIVMEHNANLTARLLEFQHLIYERLILALLRIDKQVGRPGDQLADIPRALPGLTHEVFADDIGTTRELVTQYMNRLRKADAIRYSRKAIALWPERLRDLLSTAKSEKPEGEHA